MGITSLYVTADRENGVWAVNRTGRAQRRDRRAPARAFGGERGDGRSRAARGFFCGKVRSPAVLLLRGESGSDRPLCRTAIRGCLGLLFFDPLAFPAARHESIIPVQESGLRSRGGGHFPLRPPPFPPKS